MKATLPPALCAVEYGRGDLPLLLLHGIGGGKSSWVPVAERLAARQRVVVPDLLGFGHSPWPDVPYAVGDHLAAIEALLAAHAPGWLNGMGTIDLAGHSMGAILAAELAARHPGRVRRLALVGLPYFRSAAEARESVGRLGLLARLTVLGHWGARRAPDPRHRGPHCTA